MDLDNDEKNNSGYEVAEPEIVIPTKIKEENNNIAPPKSKENTMGGLFSLADLEKEVEAEMVETAKQNENNTVYTKDEFVGFINTFIIKNETELSGVERGILKEHNFTTENNILKYELSTITLKESLLLIKSKILDFLRKECQSNKINLEITINAKIEEDKERQPYSPKEKLKKMQEEYPFLSDFINKFEFRFKM